MPKVIHIQRLPDKYMVSVDRIVRLKINDLELEMDDLSLSHFRDMVTHVDRPVQIGDYLRSHVMMKGLVAAGLAQATSNGYRALDELKVLRSTLIDQLDACQDAHDLVFDDEFISKLPEPLRLGIKKLKHNGNIRRQPD